MLSVAVGIEIARMGRAYLTNIQFLPAADAIVNKANYIVGTCWYLRWYLAARAMMQAAMLLRKANPDLSRTHRMPLWAR